MRRRRSWLAGILLCAWCLGVPASTAAAEDTAVLPGDTVAAEGVDLDGDGIEELVRITSDSGPPWLRVDAWRLDAAEGRWVRLGDSQPALDDPIDGDGVAYAVDVVTAALIPWQLDGHERLLAVSGLSPFVNPEATCCLVVSEVRRAAGGGVELVDLASETDRSLETVLAIDMDADGTDELLTQGWDIVGDEAVGRLTVLRWDGARFQSVGQVEGLGVAIGESDGVPGVEVIAQDIVEGGTTRISLRGEVVVTEALDPGPFGPISTVVGIAGGMLIRAGDAGLTSEGVLQLLRWPRDGSPEVVAQRSNPSYPLVFSVGTGDETLILIGDATLMFSGRTNSAAIFDLDLERVAQLPVWDGADRTADILRRLSDAGTQVNPYIGMLPADPNPEAEAIINGVGVRAGPDGPRIRELSPLIGMMPVARVGRGDWLALLGRSGVGFGFSPFYGPSPNLFPASFGAALSVVQADALDGYAVPDEEVGIELDGAVELANGRLAAQGTGFRVMVDAPSGSTVRLTGATEETSLVAEGGRVALEVEPRTRAQVVEDVSFVRWLVVVTPEGRIHARQLQGDFVRTALQVAVEARTDAPALRSTITGQAPPGSLVSGGGVSATTGADGHFELTVDAPAWPQDVVLAVTDPLGRQTSTTVTVIGLVDYRGLPWPAILGLLTAIGAAVLYLRVPRTHRALRPVASDGDDAVLEEIDGV